MQTFDNIQTLIDSHVFEHFDRVYTLYVIDTDVVINVVIIFIFSYMHRVIISTAISFIDTLR